MLTPEQLDFKKGNGLIPAIVQDANTGIVLMHAYMNEEAFVKTQEIKKVTFFSRSRNELWTKGETSGNFLKLIDIQTDCDRDTLLVKAIPTGPVCHTGASTCFGEQSQSEIAFLWQLQSLIQERKNQAPEGSYTAKLFEKGPKKIAQKVGEEAVELILEVQDKYPELLLNETADLVYHLLVLLTAKGHSLGDVIQVLKQRHS